MSSNPPRRTIIDEEGDRKREHKAIQGSILTLIFRQYDLREQNTSWQTGRQRDRVDRLAPFLSPYLNQKH